MAKKKRPVRKKHARAAPKRHKPKKESAQHSSAQPQNTQHFWERILRLWGFSQKKTAPHHPKLEHHKKHTVGKGHGPIASKSAIALDSALAGASGGDSAKNFRIVTDFDKILKEVDKMGAINATALRKKLGMAPRNFNECCAILEKNGMIRLEYPVVGPMKIISAKYRSKREKKESEGRITLSEEEIEGQTTGKTMGAL